MSIVRTILATTCLVVMSVCVSLWLTLATVQATLLNRDIVKGWLHKSGVYGQGLTAAVEVNQPASDALLSQQTIAEAVRKTFPASYVQESTESALDATYDWLEGKKPTATFAIPIHDKRQTFIHNLAVLLEPHIAALPVCSDVGASNCRPAYVTVQQMAKNIAEGATSGEVFLNKPITEQSFALNPSPYIELLRNTIVNITFIIWTLLLLAALAATSYVLLQLDRVRGLLRIGRRLVIGSVLPLVIGGVMMYLGAGVPTPSTMGPAMAQQVELVNSIVRPILQVVVPDIGRRLAFFSGLITLLGLVLWITAVIIRKKRTRQELLRVTTVPVVQPEAHSPPIAKPPQQL